MSDRRPHVADLGPCPGPGSKRRHRRTDAEALARWKRRHTGETLTAYRCPVPGCGAWHVGHRSPGRRR